jgi:hypothetical protein
MWEKKAAPVTSKLHDLWFEVPQKLSRLGHQTGGAFCCKNNENENSKTFMRTHLRNFWIFFMSCPRMYTIVVVTHYWY